MTQIESLLEERDAIENDYVRFKSKLNAWTHDLLINRLDMIDSMLDAEGYYNN